VRILLFGKNGQLGWELQRALAPLGEVLALDQEDPGGDLRDPSAVTRTLREFRPDVIVNAAAYTAVDKAESERDAAYSINSVAPGLLAEEGRTLGNDVLLVHYSTDYVFDGSGATPWQEESPTGPLNVYGASKLAGEQAVRTSGCRHLILRTSWLYASRGQNFARTMLRLAGDKDLLTVIDDQWGAPTGADLVADVSAHAIRATRADPDKAGTYHVVAAGETSWHEYAQRVIATARAAGLPVRVRAENVRAVPTSTYVTPARRPLNSRLATAKLESAFGLRMPDWRQGVDRMLTEIMGR
jgi:dTDP-4-dehydrorhamnose reductase